MATLFLFGEPVGSLSGKLPAYAEGFLEAFEAAFDGSGMRIALGPLKALVPNAQWLAACQATHRFVDPFVDQALANRARKDANGAPSSGAEGARHTLLGAMAEQTSDRDQLRSQCLQALMAAQETTAVLISNVLWNLARHPACQQKVRAEVASASQTLDFDTLARMPYLRHVLNETLRLYPNFPQFNRVALRDTVLPRGGGRDGRAPVFCPAGTGFDTGLYVLHRRRELWGPNADEFRPERWETHKPGAWEFLPFAGGERGCMGKQKALAEAAYVLVRLLREFANIEGRDARPWKGHVKLTVKNTHGCKIAVCRRT